jgi:hypothetical protein
MPLYHCRLITPTTALDNLSSYLVTFACVPPPSKSECVGSYATSCTSGRALPLSVPSSESDSNTSSIGSLPSNRPRAVHCFRYFRSSFFVVAFMI